MARTETMYTNRDVTLRTTKGHCIRFKRNEPKNVPRSVQDEAMRIGAIPVEPDQVGQAEEPKGPSKPETRAEIDDAVLLAMQEMVADNDPNEFTGTGMPKVPSISKRVGFNVDTAERDRLWEKLSAELATKGSE